MGNITVVCVLHKLTIVIYFTMTIQFRHYFKNRLYNNWHVCKGIEDAKAMIFTDNNMFTQNELNLKSV